MSYCHRGLFAGCLAIQAFLAGCAHGHVETVPNGQVQESATPLPTLPPVVLYAIPPIEPKGKVCIRSLGREQLPGPRGRLLSFLHISMAVENIADPATWTLDRRDMKLNFIGGVIEDFGERPHAGHSPGRKSRARPVFPFDREKSTTPRELSVEASSRK